MATQKPEVENINPIKNRDFGLATHRRREFDAVVPSGTKREDLEDPRLWVHVAQQLQQWDEIRVISEDHTFMARLICMFSHGTDARMKVIMGCDLDGADDAVELGTGKYDIVLRGQKKFCIINKENGDVIKEMIPTKVEATRELDDYLKALRM